MQRHDSFRDWFSRDEIPIIALVTYILTLLAWLAIINRWLPMPGEAAGRQMGMSDPGVPEAMALSNGATGAGVYLLMWGVMMIAMMYPSTVPLFRLYYRTLDGTTGTKKATRVGAFMGTYAVLWTLTGIVPLVVNAMVPIAAIANESAGVLLGGTLLVLAGYQLSPYKDRCLKQCRSPMGFLFSHHRPGVRGAIRMSWTYSVYCIGCCWALFAFMVVVGSMNILWMALIAIVLSLERVVTGGDRLAKAIGVLAGVAGLSSILITIL